MTSDNSQPPIGWRYCGSQCKLWRERAGVTRDALAKESNYEYETVKSMELGRRRPSLRLLEVADALCGAQGLLLAAVPFLKPEPFESFSRDFIRYEAEAVVVSSYEGQQFPGLLQTEETIRALLTAHWPSLEDEVIEERTRGRLERQGLLDAVTKSFNFVIGEAAFRNEVTDGDALRRQLLHLVETGQRRNVTVQVLRFCRRPHPGLDGSFVLLQTPEHEYLSYEEGQTTGVLKADAETVGSVTRRYAMILQAALGPEESADFIGNLAEEL
ncbi:helix-turn-helix transcriptional regulator [Streptomyces sp. NBC_01477]|uniref:helix-turn-helix transcriptional regulator n=1 Tax=Streptomyces sp. NBC_01477 TaxID=2976015 RepID=UPI002E2EB330|nr:helix-turn-helix transcriptional regulator [Streptomyces sp. NBC_01477]